VAKERGCRRKVRGNAGENSTAQKRVHVECQFQPKQVRLLVYAMRQLHTCVVCVNKQSIVQNGRIAMAPSLRNNALANALQVVMPVRIA